MKTLHNCFIFLRSRHQCTHTALEIGRESKANGCELNVLAAITPVRLSKIGFILCLINFCISTWYTIYIYIYPKMLMKLASWSRCSLKLCPPIPLSGIGVINSSYLYLLDPSLFRMSQFSHRAFVGVWERRDECSGIFRHNLCAIGQRSSWWTVSVHFLNSLYTFVGASSGLRKTRFSLTVIAYRAKTLRIPSRISLVWA